MEPLLHSDKIVSENRSDFFAGLVTGAFMGGVVGGVLGAVLAQQLSDRGKPKSSRGQTKSRRNGNVRATRQLTASVDSQELLDEVRQDADLAIAEARQSLEDKISELNAAIEDTRARFLSQDEITGNATELQDAN